MVRNSSPIRRLAVVCLALALGACESNSVTSPPTGDGPQTGPPAGSVAPGETFAPGTTAVPGGPITGNTPSVPDLPAPRLADPFEIGEALYDPSKMAQAVVSLLSLMGVGLYADDGAPIDTGAVTKAGDPWLFQSEVWHLIDMGKEDLLEGIEDGPSFRLDDLYRGLQPGLPADFTLEQFRSAYEDSYARHPEDLAPSVMLGQPINSSTPLTRTQLWLLYMDGFSELAPASSASARGGPVAAAGRPRFGTANARLPPLVQPQGYTYEQWRELVPHYRTIDGLVKFSIDTDYAHEGHGGPGTRILITARNRGGRSFVSPVSGAVLLEAGTGTLEGMQVYWESDDLDIYNAHGTLGASLPMISTTDASGSAEISYTPKREVANGQGALANDVATITASATVADLLRHAYRISDPKLAYWLFWDFQRQIRVTGQTWIEWHTPGIEIEIVNTYDVTVDAGTGGLLAFAHRKGTDSFTGTLTKRSDGTYRGVLRGNTKAAAQMEFAAGVSNIKCEDTTDSNQFLTVVARRRDPVIDPALDVLTSGAFGPDDFVLTFYPQAAPIDPGRCQGTIDYLGPGPNGQPMSGSYASYSDSRFTDPSLGGLRIHLPKAGEKLVYEDRRLIAENVLPVTGVDSLFTITVTRHPGS